MVLRKENVMEERPQVTKEMDFTNIVPFSGTREEMAPAERMLMEGQALQKVQTAYTTAIAVQKPRSIARVTSNVLEEAKFAGADFYYGWIAKTKKGPVRIEGPSIDLAMCLARNYGNCVIDIEGNETMNHFMMKGIFIDLESGFTCPRLFRQRKGQSLGGKMEDDHDRQEDIVFQIGQSKAIRNAIVRAMPRWLIDKAIAIAKQAEIQNIKEESPALARAKVLQFFEQYGVDQEKIEVALNTKIDSWTAEQIAELRGMATALKEGRVAAKELFPDIGIGEKATKKEAEPPKTEDEGEKEKDNGEKDPIRAQYKNLKTTGFKPWLESHAKYIPTLEQKYQDEIRAKYMDFRKQGKPGYDVPYLLDEQKKPPLVEPKNTGELEKPPQKEQKSTPIALDEERVLSLVKGAKLDSWQRLAIPCPDKGNRHVYVGNCKICELRNGCPAFSEYDKTV